jgi:hypothetical protein
MKLTEIIRKTALATMLGASILLTSCKQIEDALPTNKVIKEKSIEEFIGQKETHFSYTYPSAGNHIMAKIRNSSTEFEIGIYNITNGELTYKEKINHDKTTLIKDEPNTSMGKYFFGYHYPENQNNNIKYKTVLKSLEGKLLKEFEDQDTDFFIEIILDNTLIIRTHKNTDIGYVIYDNKNNSSLSLEKPNTTYGVIFYDENTNTLIFHTTEGNEKYLTSLNIDTGSKNEIKIPNEDIESEVHKLNNSNEYIIMTKDSNNTKRFYKYNLATNTKSIITEQTNAGKTGFFSKEKFFQYEYYDSNTNIKSTKIIEIATGNELNLSNINEEIRYFVELGDNIALNTVEIPSGNINTYYTDPATGNSTRILTNGSFLLELSPDGNYLAGSEEGKKIKLFDKSGNIVYEETSEESNIHNLDDEVLIYSMRTNNINILKRYDIKTGNVEEIISGEDISTSRAWERTENIFIENRIKVQNDNSLITLQNYNTQSRDLTLIGIITGEFRSSQGLGGPNTYPRIGSYANIFTGEETTYIITKNSIKQLR